MVTAELVRRCGELKGELVAFARASRFARRVAWNDVNHIDQFILQQQLGGGRTMVDLFVASRADLSEDERRIVLGWHDVVETLIEVRGHEEDVVDGVGVIDELPYRIHSTMPIQRTPRHPSTSYRADLQVKRPGTRHGANPASC